MHRSGDLLRGWHTPLTGLGVSHNAVFPNKRCQGSNCTVGRALALPTTDLGSIPLDPVGSLSSESGVGSLFQGLGCGV